MRGILGRKSRRGRHEAFAFRMRQLEREFPIKHEGVRPSGSGLPPRSSNPQETPHALASYRLGPATSCLSRRGRDPRTRGSCGLRRARPQASPPPLLFWTLVLGVNGQAKRSLSSLRRFFMSISGRTITSAAFQKRSKTNLNE